MNSPWRNVMTKKKFWLRGIEPGMDFGQYAQHVEDVMNLMTTAGYAVQMIDRPQGTLILGALQDPAPPSPLLRILGMVPEEGKPADMSPRTRELLSRFAQAVPSHTNPAQYPKEISQRADVLLRDFSVPELTHAAAELEKEAETHAADHQDATCVYPEFVRQIVVVLRAAMHNALQ
jgi:hypothetical protein